MLLNRFRSQISFVHLSFPSISFHRQNLSGEFELESRVNSAACYCSAYQLRPSGVYEIDPQTHVWDRVADNDIHVMPSAPMDDQISGLLEELLNEDHLEHIQPREGGGDLFV